MLTWLLHSRLFVVVCAFTTCCASPPPPPPPATVWPDALRVLSLATDDDELVTAMNTVSKALKTKSGETDMRNALLLFNNWRALARIVALASSDSSSTPTASTTTTTRALLLLCQFAEEGVLANRLLHANPKCPQAILTHISREEDDSTMWWAALANFATHIIARPVLLVHHMEAILPLANDAITRAADPSAREVQRLIYKLAPYNKAAEELSRLHSLDTIASIHGWVEDEFADMRRPMFQ